jgi:hypothetical protein
MDIALMAQKFQRSRNSLLPLSCAIVLMDDLLLEYVDVNIGC